MSRRDGRASRRPRSAETATTSGIDEPGLPVDPELVRGEHRVAVRADAVVRDVAEVEEAGEADGDVEPEREQGEDERDRARHGGSRCRCRSAPSAAEGAPRRRRRTRTRPASGRGRTRSRSRPTIPPRASARSPERATHSSAPIARPVARSGRVASPQTFWVPESRRTPTVGGAGRRSGSRNDHVLVRARTT